MRHIRRWLAYSFSTTFFIFSSYFLQCIAAENECIFDGNNTRHPFTFTAYEHIGKLSGIPIRQYKLKIPVKNETDCLVKFSEPEALTWNTLNLSAECEVATADKTRCFNEWYLRHPKHTNLYYMYYYTNDSALPEEGRYRLQLNNGMNDISIRRHNDGQIFE